MMIGDGADPVGRAEQEVRGLFADDHALDRAATWAKGVLAADGIDPTGQQLRAMRSLRRADRRLSLVSARYLVTLVAGRAPRRRTSRRNPLLR